VARRALGAVFAGGFLGAAARALIADELTRETGLVTSELVPARASEDA
jgi:hypothetical protein